MTEPSDGAIYGSFIFLFSLPIFGKLVGLVAMPWAQCLILASLPIALPLVILSVIGAVYIPAIIIDYLLRRLGKKNG
jgi:hypothetical protein